MSKIKVDEMFRFMRYETSKVPSNNAVPSCAFPLVKLSFYRLCNILFNCVLSNCILGNFNGLLLHILAHINSLHLHVKLAVFALVVRHDGGNMVEVLLSEWVVRFA